jgi:glutathione reductase (NADPH)
VKHFDLIVIGAGSGGLAAAQRAASYGKKVALIEMSKIGGTCVNLGCVPKKIMWYAGQIEEALQLSKDFGFSTKSKLDFKKLVNHREKFIKSLQEIYTARIKKSHITYLPYRAVFIDAKTLQVHNEKISANFIVIATGSESNIPKIKGAEYGIDSDGFFDLKQLPKTTAIIGGGYIALELAFILNQLGSKVTMLIRKDTPVRNFDSLISKSLMDIMKAQDIKVLPYHETEEIVKERDKTLTIHCKNKKKLTQFEAAIFAIGRSPSTHTLNLHVAGVKLNMKDNIITDKFETTNIPHIFAIGDVAGKKLLTPVAVAAGRRLSERLFGTNKNLIVDYENIPTAIFTHPPAAAVGLSEQDAADKYGEENIAVETTQFHSMYYALTAIKTLSAMKLIYLKDTGKIIGCHLIGINADEIIQGFAVAIKMGATKQDLNNTIGIHPTSAEELLTI